jgi:hypothetical protein
MRLHPIGFGLMFGGRLVLMLLGAVAMAVALSYLLAALLPANPDWIPHLATHASIGVPASILAWFGWRERAQKRLAQSVATTILLLGISIIGAAQVLEAVSAWLEYPRMGGLHTGAGALTALGLPLSASGLVVIAGSLIFKRPPPRWLLIASGILLSILTILSIRTLIGL